MASIVGPWHKLLSQAAETDSSVPDAFLRTKCLWVPVAVWFKTRWLFFFLLFFQPGLPRLRLHGGSRGWCKLTTSSIAANFFLFPHFPTLSCACGILYDDLHLGCSLVLGCSLEPLWSCLCQGFLGWAKPGQIIQRMLNDVDKTRHHFLKGSRLALVQFVLGFLFARLGKPKVLGVVLFSML